MYNTKLVNDTIVITGNDATTTILDNVVLRATLQTEPIETGQASITPVPKFTSLMMDNRAPGIFTAALAGPTAKLEWLAELMVSTDVVSTVARALLDHSLIAKVNEMVLRSNQRFKKGTIIMSHPMLYRTLLEITGAGTERQDSKRVVARVLTELLARIYSECGVMMPYRSVYAQSYAFKPIATADDLMRAANVASVTETLESLKLGVALREKEFSPAVLETVLGPLLLAASNRLLSTEKYNRWMRDAAALVGKFIVNRDDDSLNSLRDDANLQLLASNASFALGAIEKAFLTDVLSPAHEHTELLAHAALRLRELRRYSSVSMEKFAGMYSSKIVKTAKGKVAGVFVARNNAPTAQLKGVALVEEMGITVPMPSPFIDPYVPMLNEFTNAAFGGERVTNAASAFAQNLIARRMENGQLETGGTVVGFDITGSELRYLAVALADELVVVDRGLQTALYFGVHDGKIPYETDAYYTGTNVYTQDPAEVLILQGEDMNGTQQFPTRPQTYSEDLMSGLLDSADPLLYGAATRVLKLTLPLPDGKTTELNLSLQNLLTGDDATPVIKSFIAHDLQMAARITALLSLAVITSDELASTENPIDAVMAEQIATGTHMLFGDFTRQVGFRRFMKTVNIRLLAKVAGDNRDMRASLLSIVAQHDIAIRLAATFLLRTGLIPFGLQDDVIEMFSTSRAIERAATSEAFAALIHGTPVR